MGFVLFGGSGILFCKNLRGRFSGQRGSIFRVRKIAKIRLRDFFVSQIRSGTVLRDNMLRCDSGRLGKGLASLNRDMELSVNGSPKLVRSRSHSGTLMLLAIISLLAVPLKCHGQLSSVKRIRLQGLYVNEVYGFSVHIPPSLIVYVSCDGGGVCGSTHGFTGTIESHPEVTMYVFPEYSPAGGRRPRLFFPIRRRSLM